MNFLLKRHSKINGKEIYIADSIVKFENLRDKEILKVLQDEKTGHRQRIKNLKSICLLKRNIS